MRTRSALVSLAAITLAAVFFPLPAGAQVPANLTVEAVPAHPRTSDDVFLRVSGFSVGSGDEGDLAPPSRRREA